jgi:hypothetical protein
MNGVYCTEDGTGTYGKILGTLNGRARVEDANEPARIIYPEACDLRPVELVACPECGHVADEEALRFVPRSYAAPGYCAGCTTCIPHIEREYDDHPEI